MNLWDLNKLYRLIAQNLFNKQMNVKLINLNLYSIFSKKGLMVN